MAYATSRIKADGKVFEPGDTIKKADLGDETFELLVAQGIVAKGSPPKPEEEEEEETEIEASVEEGN